MMDSDRFRLRRIERNRLRLHAVGNKVRGATCPIIMMRRPVIVTMAATITLRRRGCEAGCGGCFKHPLAEHRPAVPIGRQRQTGNIDSGKEGRPKSHEFKFRSLPHRKVKQFKNRRGGPTRRSPPSQ
jgi:hypothetical protein